MAATLFYNELEKRVLAEGGYYNAHLHLDRIHTLSESGQTGDESSAHLALSQKHGLISGFHSSHWYEPENLKHRLNRSIDQMVACHTRRADSVIDVTNDGLGLDALKTARQVSVERKSELDFRIAAYNPLGFRIDDPERWSLIEEGAEIADFLGCLPERDDKTDYPDHIGYEETCHRMLELAAKHNCDLQVHTDQANHPNERGTERLLDVIETAGLTLGTPQEPKIWVVHMISPSLYPEDRWQRLVKRLKHVNVGVICCPSAAIGMRQLRGVMSPTTNSIARVLELCASGIQVRLGSDNFADMLSPSTTGDLTAEVFVLSAALRFDDINILAKLACGRELNDADVHVIRKHLEANDVEMAKAIRRWQADA